ncbi:hypothetical protein VC136_20930, partial [Citrobacter freundii]|nr:hypothetical protein [Citrobacter freundii]MEB2763570.1 hypothetical protein [Citrobacter freundii]
MLRNGPEDNCDVVMCLMRCAYQRLQIRSARRFYPAHTQKSPSFRMGFFTLFDACQFMAGVLPATLRAVAAQRSNPLPAD